MRLINTHKDLDVYKLSFDTAMEIFSISKRFPKEEIYSLTDQIRRSSRSVAANLSEAFRKRRYNKAFIAKLSDSEGEAAETQVWIEFAQNCGYIDQTEKENLYQKYEYIIGKIVKMIKNPEKWSF